MRIILAVPLLASVASGCVAASPKISVSPEGEPAAFVVDQTGPDTYPAGSELIISSCRYGIHHMARGDFTPSKAHAFGALLAKHVPGIAQRKVVLEQYDVYYNHRTKARGVAGAAIGGLIGSLIASGSRASEKEYPTGEFTLDTDPLRPRAPGAPVVGCEDAHEGEYQDLEGGGRSEMIVTWLRFRVDGTPYHVRSLYSIRSKRPDDVSEGVATASDQTVKAMAAAIAKGLPVTGARAQAETAAPGPIAAGASALTQAPKDTKLVPAPGPAVKPLAGDAVLHFHRPDGDYEGWGILAWEIPADGDPRRQAAGSRASLPPSGTDDFGAYWVLKASDYPSGLVGYTVVKGSQRDRAGGRTAWSLVDSQQAWVNSGDPRIYLRQDLAICEWPGP